MSALKRFKIDTGNGQLPFIQEFALPQEREVLRRKHFPENCLIALFGGDAFSRSLVALRLSEEKPQQIISRGAIAEHLDATSGRYEADEMFANAVESYARESLAMRLSFASPCCAILEDGPLDAPLRKRMLDVAITANLPAFAVLLRAFPPQDNAPLAGDLLVKEGWGVAYAIRFLRPGGKPFFLHHWGIE